MQISRTPDPLSARYQRALQFLNERVDFERFQAMPSGQRELKLDRMRTLLDRLGNPQDKLPIVHVAGTKGKGSTSAMIAAVLHASGYRTGLFTSPHLDRVEERIAVNGQPCSTDEFANLVAAIQPVVETLDHETVANDPHDHGPTYFEILTAMALLHFVRSGVQAAVLEVGLGGRLDSTNVCVPRVSVITSISFDHVQQLGGTLDSIAREKAGIVKPGVPVVSGITADEPREAIRRIARDNGCRLIELDIDFHFEYHPPHHLERQLALGRMDFWSHPCATAGLSSSAEFISKSQLEYHELPLALLGRHQAANAAVALATFNELNRQGWNISEQSIRQGMATVKWPARIEIVTRQPIVILDSAHNTASIAALMEVLKESFSVSRRLLLFATTRDKNFQEMLKLLLTGFDEIVFTQYTTNPRALPPAELDAAAFQITGRHYPIFANPAEALNHLRQLATHDDLICITGSFFLAGEMRKLL
jgi:dihydrofolate synthase/folylpolyglutamate synthase